VWGGCFFFFFFFLFPIGLLNVLPSLARFTLLNRRPIPGSSPPNLPCAGELLFIHQRRHYISFESSHSIHSVPEAQQAQLRSSPSITVNHRSYSQVNTRTAQAYLALLILPLHVNICYTKEKENVPQHTESKQEKKGYSYRVMPITPCRASKFNFVNFIDSPR